MKIIEAPDLIEFLSTRHPPKHFLSDAPLVYRGHVPLAAYLVYDGSVMRGKSMRRMALVPRGSILGLEGLLGKVPYDWHVHVKAGAQLSIIDFTDLGQLHQMLGGEQGQSVELQEELRRLLNILPKL